MSGHHPYDPAMCAARCPRPGAQLTSENCGVSPACYGPENVREAYSGGGQLKPNLPPMEQEQLHLPGVPV